MSENQTQNEAQTSQVPEDRTKADSFIMKIEYPKTLGQYLVKNTISGLFSATITIGGLELLNHYRSKKESTQPNYRVAGK